MNSEPNAIVCQVPVYHSNKLIDTDYNQIVSKRKLNFICKYAGHVQQYEKD